MRGGTGELVGGSRGVRGVMGGDWDGDFRVFCGFGGCQLTRFGAGWVQVNVAVECIIAGRVQVNALVMVTGNRVLAGV